MLWIHGAAWWNCWLDRALPGPVDYSLLELGGRMPATVAAGWLNGLRGFRWPVNAVRSAALDCFAASAARNDGTSAR